MSVRCQAWHNGALLPRDQAPQVSALDRGFLLGDSVFETLRREHGHERAWDRHFALLDRAAAAFGFVLPYSIEELHAAARRTADLLGEADVTVRVTVSRGVFAGVSPPAQAAAQVIVLAQPTRTYPAEAYRDGIESTLLQARRIPQASLDARFKTGCYLPAVVARGQLTPRGLLEGLMLTVDGRIASGTVSNVFFVHAGALLTPSLGCDCREGVTRGLVLEAAARLGVPVHEIDAEPAMLADCSELFFTNTLMDCLPVRRLDEWSYGPPGPITRRVLAALRSR